MTAASILEHPRHCLDILAKAEVSASQVAVQECVWIDVARTPGGAAAAGGQEASRQLPRRLPPQHPASSSGRARPVLRAPKGPARHGPPARHTRRLSSLQALPKKLMHHCVGEALLTDQHPGAHVDTQDCIILDVEGKLLRHASPCPAIDRSRVLLMLSCALNVSSASPSHCCQKQSPCHFLEQCFYCFQIEQ